VPNEIAQAQEALHMRCQVELENLAILQQNDIEELSRRQEMRQQVFLQAQSEHLQLLQEREAGHEVMLAQAERLEYQERDRTRNLRIQARDQQQKQRSRTVATSLPPPMQKRDSIPANSVVG
jgi:hypothetical protein